MFFFQQAMRKADFSKCKVAHLKEILRALEMDDKGRKGDLVARLVEHLREKKKRN